MILRRRDAHSKALGHDVNGPNALIYVFGAYLL